MRSISHRRVLAAVALLALVSMALAGAATAGPGKAHHRKVVARRTAARHAIARRARRKTFAPTVISRAAEVSAVELDPLTQQFVQVTFDRGVVTSASSDSITLQQRQNNAVWRTETFSIPSGAVVTLNGKAVSASQIPTGSQARVESSGPVGGSQSVVRVNAYSHGEAPLPATSQD
jgi:uncharacterized protein (DUF2126 family)